jgi:DNA-nicking Smr family endonuclease
VERRIKDPSIGSEIVEVVTGRGKHSLDGKARIKPAVAQLLKRRDIQ